MHYKTIFEVMDFVRQIPTDDLAVILSKPKTTDRKEDQSWRGVCAQHNVETSPIGLTSNKAQYEREAYLERCLAESKMKMDTIEVQLSQAKLELARMRIEMKRYE